MLYLDRFICATLLAGILFMSGTGTVYAQTQNARLYPFDFTPAPSVLANEVAVSGPDRVYIMEELKPTFDKTELHVADQEFAQNWQRLCDMLEPLKPEARLLMVNRFVNQSQNNAAKLAPVSEDWRTPAEFFAKAGHSGDYALAKYYALKALGEPVDNMCLAFVTEPNSSDVHVLLVVFQNSDFFVLDTVNDAAFHNSAPKAYLPLYYANETTSWKQKATTQTVMQAANEQALLTDERQNSRPNVQQSAARPDATNGKILLEGFRFDITPPPGKDTGVNIHKWKRILADENRFPSFKGATANISDKRLAAEWGSLYGKFRSANIYKKIVAVNNFFNQWRYKSDNDNWGQEDYWATPREFMEKSGDCEDYAIAKYFALRSLSVPSKDICLVWVQLADRQESHMILIVLDKDDFYVLDNNTSTNIIFKNGGLTQYRPIFYMNEDFTWKPAKQD